MPRAGRFLVGSAAYVIGEQMQTPGVPLPAQIPPGCGQVPHSMTSPQPSVVMPHSIIPCSPHVSGTQTATPTPTMSSPALSR